MEFLREYGVATVIRTPIVKRGVVDHAVAADWATPAAGDVKIDKDGGGAANVTNLPSATAMGNSAYWSFSLTATEMQAAQIVVTVADSATKAVEDTSFLISTYGNASARHKVNLNDSVRAGLTALPNAAAEAAGGLYTRGSGAGQINQDANGRVNVSLVAILGTTLTETAGQIAAAFKKFFDKATPTGTINSLPDAVAGAASGVAIVGSNMGSAASVTADVGITQAAADKVWGTAARALTDKAGFSLSAAYDPAKTASQAGDIMKVSSGTGANQLSLASGLVTVGTNTDKTGYSLTAGGIQAIWDQLNSLNTAANSIGNSLRLIVAAFNTTFAEPTGVPAKDASMLDKWAWMFVNVRNKRTTTATQDKVYADDASTVIGTAALSDDATTFTRGEVA